MKERLNSFVLAELFGKSLVIARDPEYSPVPQAETNSSNWYLGAYEKKIVVGVNDPDSLYLDDESLQFLSGILSACRLSLAHIALINFHHHAITYAQLKRQLQPQFLLLFGVTPVQIELPFIMPDYKVQAFDNCYIITAPSLRTLNNDLEETKKEKIMLWNGLKKMFDLK